MNMVYTLIGDINPINEWRVGFIGMLGVIKKRTDSKTELNK